MGASRRIAAIIGAGACLTAAAAAAAPCARMTYRRAGDDLTFIGEFIHAGKPPTVTIDFKRAGD